MEIVNDFTYLISNTVLSGELNVYTIIILKALFLLKRKYVDELPIHDAK